MIQKKNNIFILHKYKVLTPPLPKILTDLKIILLKKGMF